MASKAENLRGPVVLIAAVAYLSVFAGVLYRIGDEGTLVYGAARVAGGSVPYRDFFDVANPLSFYWLGGWFKLFGVRLIVARVLLVVTGALSSVQVLWLAQRAYGPRAGMLSALACTVLSVPFWPVTNHHWDSNLFYLAAITGIALYNSTGRQRYLLLAGVASGATAGFMVQKGVLALLVVLGFALTVSSPPATRTTRTRRALVVLAGAAVVPAFILVLLGAHGAVVDVFYANLVFPASQYRALNRVPYGLFLLDAAWQVPIAVLRQLVPLPLARALGGALSWPLFLVAASPALAGALVARRVWKRAGSSFDTRLLWMSGLTLWVSEAQRWDIFHLIYGSPLLLATVLGEMLSQGKGRGWREWFVRVTAFCMLALGIWQAAVAGSARQVQQTRRGPVRVFVKDAALDFLMNATRPGDSVFVYPYHPMYYFLADVRNPTRYGVLLHGYSTEEQFREATDDLRRAAPRYVLWDTVVDGVNLRRWFPTYVQPSERELVLESFLLQRYRVIGTAGGFRIMERRVDTTGG